MIIKKVAIFHTEFAYTGGAERLVFEHYKFFKEKGFNPEIFTSFVDYRKCFPKEINNYKINTFVPRFLFKVFPHEFLILLSFLFLPLFLYRLSKFDLIFAENQAGPWWAFIFSKILGKRYATYQNYPTTVTYPRKIDAGVRRNVWYVDLIINLIKPLMILIDKKVIKNAAIRFANGIYATEVCKKAYGVSFINCPGGTKLGKFNRIIFEKRFKRPYALIINRHFPAKEIETGIMAVNKYKFNLLIAGAETEYTQKLKKMVNKLNLNKYVRFIGLIEIKKWEEVFEGAMVYLYTAPEEDFGLGNIEAMAHGVPVVAWNNAGPKYIIKSGVNGYLVNLKDINDFSDKTYKLMTDKKLNFKMAKNAYRQSLKYTWEAHNNKIWTTLKKCFRF